MDQKLGVLIILLPFHHSNFRFELGKSSLLNITRRE